ncbi:MAG: PAS domain-containing protein, partial [Chloroflexota bacterium]
MQSFQSRFRQTKPVFMANIAGVTGNLHPVQQRRILMSIVLPFLVMITITTAGYAALSTPRNTYIMALLLLMTVLNAVSFVVCRTRFYRWGLAIFLAMLSMGYLGLSLLLQRVSIVYSLSLMMNAVVFIASLFYRPRTAVIFATAAVIVTVISIGASSDYTGLIDTMLIVGSTSLFYVLVIFASYVQYENTLLVDQQTDALIESEQRFRSIFEQTFQLAAFMQSDGRVIDANDNMLALVTDVDERVVGRMIWELNLWTYMDHTPEQVKAYVQQAATGHTTTTEITYTRRPGHERIFEIWLQPVHERSDDTVMISMTGRELTELKTSERRLQSEARRYRALFEEIKDGLMLVGLDNLLIIMNPAGARMLGYEATEIEGMPLEKLVGTADDMVNMENTINSLLDDQPVVPGER